MILKLKFVKKGCYWDAVDISLCTVWFERLSSRRLFKDQPYELTISDEPLPGGNPGMLILRYMFESNSRYSHCEFNIQRQYDGTQSGGISEMAIPPQYNFLTDKQLWFCLNLAPYEEQRL